MLTSTHGCSSWSLFTHWYDWAVTWAPVVVDSETRFTRTFILSTDDSSHGVHIKAVMSRTRPQSWQRWEVVVLVLANQLGERIVFSVLFASWEVLKSGLWESLKSEMGKMWLVIKWTIWLIYDFTLFTQNKLGSCGPFLQSYNKPQDSTWKVVVTSWLLWRKRGSTKPSDILHHPAHAVIA